MGSNPTPRTILWRASVAGDKGSRVIVSLLCHMGFGGGGGGCLSSSCVYWGVVVSLDWCARVVVPLLLAAYDMPPLMGGLARTFLLDGGFNALMRRVDQYSYYLSVRNLGEVLSTIWNYRDSYPFWPSSVL